MMICNYASKTSQRTELVMLEGCIVKDTYNFTLEKVVTWSIYRATNLTSLRVVRSTDGCHILFCSGSDHFYNASAELHSKLIKESSNFD